MSVESLRSPREAFASPVRRGAREASATMTALLIALGVLLPIMRLVPVGGILVNFCAADVVMPLVLLALRRQWTRSRALGGWLLALWVVNLVSWSLSLSMLTPITFLRETMKVVTCYLYALVGYGIGSDARAEQLFVKSLAWSSVLIAVGAVSAYLVRQPAAFITDSRVVGSFTDPNAFAVFLAMQIALVGTFGFAWLAVPILLAGGLATLSRTGLISLTASVFLSSLHAGARRFLLIFAACALALVAAWGSFSSHSLFDRIGEYQSSLGYRQELWSLALGTGAKHPVFGVGRGNWESVTGSFEGAHNTFLQTIADTGFVGLMAFAGPVAFWLGAGMKRRATRAWAICVLVGLLGGLAIALDNFRLFWLAVGVLTAKLAVEVEAERAARAERWGQTAATVG